MFCTSEKGFSGTFGPSRDFGGPGNFGDRHFFQDQREFGFGTPGDFEGTGGFGGPGGFEIPVGFGFGIPPPPGYSGPSGFEGRGGFGCRGRGVASRGRSGCGRGRDTPSTFMHPLSFGHHGFGDSDWNPRDSDFMPSHPFYHDGDITDEDYLRLRKISNQRNVSNTDLFQKAHEGKTENFDETIPISTDKKEKKYKVGIVFGPEIIQDSLKICRKNNVLTISVRTEKSSEDDSFCLHQEYTKKIALPENADLSQLESSLSPEGVLLIQAPLLNHSEDAPHQADQRLQIPIIILNEDDKILSF